MITHAESQATIKVRPNRWGDCNLCWHDEQSADAQDFIFTTPIGQNVYAIALCGRHQQALIDAISPGFRQQNAELLAALKVSAPALHSTAFKMGCYTAGSFESCDTPLCVAARAAIARAEGREEP